MTSVVVAYPHGWEKSSVFDECLHRLIEHRSNRGQATDRLPSFGVTGRLEETRNNQVQNFLDLTTADALLCLDDDMAFAPTLLDQLLDVSDPVEKPVIGGLCFGQRITHFDEYMIPHVTVFPTIYKWDAEGNLFGSVDDYPENAYVRCAGTGAACLLIHRPVLELIRENFGDTWFTPIMGKNDHYFSEDLSFCMRLMSLEIPLHVHTGCKTGHQKPRWLTDDVFKAQQSVAAERWVVIPTKNNLTQLQDLIQQLRHQGEADGIVVVDNGMGRAGRNWLSTQKDLVSLDMPGVGIHHMWNAGRDACPPGADVAFLNDDLRIGENFLSGLQAGLTGNVVVVSPNYDGRTEPMLTTDICAGRMDGTGGVAGFAFMVSGRFLRNYRFPEDLMWWYGDNDLMRTVHKHGATGAVAVSPTVEHLDGGSQTGDWKSPEMEAQLAADEATHMKTWNLVKLFAGEQVVPA